MRNSSYYLVSFFIVIVGFQIAVNSFAQQGLSKSQHTADKHNYLANLTEALKKPHPNNRIINIVCLGNSIPAGYTKTPLIDPFSAYPHLLHRKLKQRYPYAIINVIVSARGSEFSESGYERFKRDTSQFSPDLLTIDYGMTDRIRDLSKAKIYLSSIIMMAKISGTKVLLLTPTPHVNANMSDPSHPLNQQAELIRNLAKEHEVGLVDSSTAFQQYFREGGKVEDVLSNGINHPNPNGHEIVANEILAWFP